MEEALHRKVSSGQNSSARGPKYFEIVHVQAYQELKPTYPPVFDNRFMDAVEDITRRLQEKLWLFEHLYINELEEVAIDLDP
eukprot:7504503-Lingulodinium_polyedra.AAC.1